MFKKRFRGKSTSFKILKIFIQNFLTRPMRRWILVLKLIFYIVIKDFIGESLLSLK